MSYDITDVVCPFCKTKYASPDPESSGMKLAECPECIRRQEVALAYLKYKLERKELK